MSYVTDDKLEGTLNERRDDYDGNILLEIRDNTTNANITSIETAFPTYGQHFWDSFIMFELYSLLRWKLIKTRFTDTTLSVISVKNNIDTTLPLETLGNSTSKILDAYIDEIVSNLTLSNILNETAIDENDIEEYLSNRKYRNTMTRKLLMIIVYK